MVLYGLHGLGIGLFIIGLQGGIVHDVSLGIAGLLPAAGGDAAAAVCSLEGPVRCEHLQGLRASILVAQQELVGVVALALLHLQLHRGWQHGG